MPIDLGRHAAEVDLASSGYASLAANLQAGIIRSHGRDNTRHLFIRFTGSAAAARRWIREQVAPAVTTAKDQLDQSHARVVDKKADGGVVTGFLLSAEGYFFIGFDPSRLPCKAFRKGMKDRHDYVVPDVFGPIDLKLRNRDPQPSLWEAGFRGAIHALVTIADDEIGGDIARLLNRVELVTHALAGVGEVVQVDSGIVLRRGGEPIEHFGYRDGISQPLFTASDLADYDSKQPEPRQPGQWDPAASLDLILVPDTLATAPDCYGSFLVYRKLAQDVVRFKAREDRLGAKMGYPDEQAGAFLVGRFEDGTAISVEAKESGAKYPANGFLHSDDPKGARCPRHAHVRKTNPRGTTPGTSLEQERKRRIARRAIPYGHPHSKIDCDRAALPPEEAVRRDEDMRGLLFMCFQASIEQQFEFIQRVWVDNNDFPTGTLGFRNTGDDPLIGQDLDEGQHWPKAWDKPDEGTRRLNVEAEVTLKGGEYLFAPSKPFLLGL